MADRTSRVQAAYDEWANVYDSNDNPTRDLNAQVLRKATLPWKGRRVLEVGCGTGLNTAYLSQQSKEVVGVDLSEAMLERARQRVRAENVRFTRGDIQEEWAFGDATFDMVVANLILEHVENLAHVFGEAHRVLGRGGYFYVSELHPYKQLRGTQATFERAETGEEVPVDAFVHSVSEYVNGGVQAGFTLRRLDEWQHEDDDAPRLLTVLFEKTD